jgi:hypothetical protein
MHARRAFCALVETSAYLTRGDPSWTQSGREFILRREIPLPDMSVSLRLYDRMRPMPRPPVDNPRGASPLGTPPLKLRRCPPALAKVELPTLS